MDAENQAQVKKIAEGAENEGGSDNIIVVLGASDIEGALISAETVTVGDPSFTGPLAGVSLGLPGVSLGLPVYHILEPEIKKAIPGDVYEENVGIWELTVDTKKIGQEFKAIREKNSSERG
jgi:betaine reductase